MVSSVRLVIFRRKQINLASAKLISSNSQIRLGENNKQGRYITAEEKEEGPRPTLFSAARLMTLTPSLSALRMASSICLLMPSAAKGKKYCKSNTIAASDTKTKR